MSDARRKEISRLIESGGLDELAARVYQELRGLAAAYMQRERADHTLQPTALANEAYVRLVGDAKVAWKGRAQFLAIAARSMRQVLVEHARARGTEKRGGRHARISLSDTSGVIDQSAIDLLDLDEALRALADVDERKARIVELRFFAGLSMKEVAEALKLSETTVEDDWYLARAWLRRHLGGA